MVGGIDTSSLQVLPQGLFVLARDELAGDLLLPVESEAGPALDEYHAWLDVDLDEPASGPRQFVGRVYHPDLSQIGVTPARVLVDPFVRRRPGRTRR